MRSSKPNLKHCSEIGLGLQSFSLPPSPSVGQTSSLIRKFQGVDACEAGSRSVVGARVDTSYAGLTNGVTKNTLDIVGEDSSEYNNTHTNDVNRKELLRNENSDQCLKRGSCNDTTVSDQCLKRVSL